MKHTLFIICILFINAAAAQAQTWGTTFNREDLYIGNIHYAVITGIKGGVFVINVTKDSLEASHVMVAEPSVNTELWPYVPPTVLTYISNLYRKPLFESEWSPLEYDGIKNEIGRQHVYDVTHKYDTVFVHNGWKYWATVANIASVGPVYRIDIPPGYYIDIANKMEVGDHFVISVNDFLYKIYKIVQCRRLPVKGGKK